MLDKLLPKDMYDCLMRDFDINKLKEIRVRNNQPLKVNAYGVYEKVRNVYGNDYFIVNKFDIDYILAKATNYSIYSANESIIDGYISYYGGIRIGVAGEGVIEKGQIITIKNISYLNIRIANEVKFIADSLKYDFEKPISFIIISPPGCGKTTLLREMLRRISIRNNNCLLIDERGEVSSINNGEVVLDVGDNTDIVSFIPKTLAMEGIIRAMRPDIIFTDEIYSKKEVDLIIDTLRCGIKTGLTIHAENRFELLKNNDYRTLLEHIPYVIELSSSPYIGSIQFEGFVKC